MTYDDVLSIVRNMAHRSETDPAHEDTVTIGLTLAINQVSRFAEWYFTEVELKIALAANTRLYAFPVLDAQGSAIVMSTFDKRSFRTASVNQIFWEDDVGAIDQLDPDWVDGETGTPQAVGVTAGQIFLYKTPSAGFVASNPYLYARGWRKITVPTVTTGEIEDIPDDWHEVLVPGVLAWVYRQARANPGRVQEATQEFYGKLNEMRGKCVAARGFQRDVIPPANVYRRGYSKYRGNSDYGTRH